MFRTLLALRQELLLKRQLVYCVRVMSVGWLAAPGLEWNWRPFNSWQSEQHVHHVGFTILIGTMSSWHANFQVRLRSQLTNTLMISTINLFAI
jgi:hypothetical protein